MILARNVPIGQTQLVQAEQRLELVAGRAADERASVGARVRRLLVRAWRRELKKTALNYYYCHRLASQRRLP